MATLRDRDRATDLDFYTYKSTGVDIDRADDLVRFISKRATRTSRPGNVSHIGSFGALFDLSKESFSDPLLVTSTDGVGTKLRLAIDARQHRTIGIDLVAMCVNDILVHGATPLFFLDYFATGNLELGTAKEVMASIIDGCTQAGCALIGGETAQMPGLYESGDYDLAGFVVGAVERSSVLPREKVDPGTILLGLKSSGLHSNGFSLIRKFLTDQSINLLRDCPFDKRYETLAEGLLEPTRIYVPSVLKALRVGGIVAMAHITGGGIKENLPRVLPRNTFARIDASSWERDRPPVYTWLLSAGLRIEHDEFYRVFNAGIGMILAVEPGYVSKLMGELRQSGETVYQIGEICPGSGEPYVLI